MPLLVLTVPMAFAQSEKCNYNNDIIHDIRDTIISDVREQTSKAFKLPNWLLQDIYNDILNGDCIPPEKINNITNILVSSSIDEIDMLKDFIRIDVQITSSDISTSISGISDISNTIPDKKSNTMSDNIGKYKVGELLSNYGFPLYDVSFEYEYNYYKAFIDVLGYDDISPNIKDRVYLILSTQFIPQVNQKCACAEYLSMYQLEQLDNELTSLMKQYNINKLSDIYTSF